ncbi:hypothetical protein V1290_002814 [Bradyrhizobium sp. AZCC 1578]
MRKKFPLARFGRGEMPVIQEKQWDLWYRRSRDTHVGISPSSYLDNIRSAQAIAADCIGNEEIIYG